MHTFLFTAVLALSAAPAPDRETPGERQPAAGSLQATIDGIWKDAAVANDAAYQTLAERPKLKLEPIAPLDMRKMVVDWPEPRNLRGWPQQLHVGFEHERVTAMWSGEIGCGDERKAAREHFIAELEKRGYRALDDKAQAAFDRETKFDAGTKRQTYARKVGETELLVSFDAQGYVGSSTYHSGVQFKWLARRAYRGPQPKLADALAALPAALKVKFLDDKFYTALGEEPIAWLSSGHDLTIKFAKPVTDKLIAALEQTRFEYQSEASPHRDGTQQKTWYRFTDITYAHVITSADGKDLRFFCQAPQHHGEPIAVKPPKLHPSLSLPPEKRPILEFDQLAFDDGEVQRKTKLFQDLAESLAQKDWQIQLYKDHRYSLEPSYAAYWQTSVTKNASYISKIRPFRGVAISLQGKHADGVDRLRTLYVGGTMVPQAGWGAMVTYSMSPSPDGKVKAHLSATAGQAQADRIFSFDRSFGNSSIQLTQHSVTAEAREADSFQYRFQTQSPPADFARTLKLLTGTAESLRDEVLADIAALRKQSREELDEGGSVMLYDLTNVRSDNPPREILAAIRRPPSEKTKQALWKQIDEQLAAQEASLRTHFREIHAAVQQALPLQELAKELSVPEEPKK